jgi:hypothetical protein
MKRGPLGDAGSQFFGLRSFTQCQRDATSSWSLREKGSFRAVTLDAGLRTSFEGETHTFYEANYSEPRRDEERGCF